MGKKSTKKTDVVKSKFSLKKVAAPIGHFLTKISSPVRDSKTWKFLRRTVLRSPFRGYFVNSFKELKQVTWPDRKTSIKLTFAVIIFSVAFSLFTQALDFGFEKLARKLFLS